MFSTRPLWYVLYCGKHHWPLVETGVFCCLLVCAINMCSGFCSYAGLTETLLQKEQTDHDEVIEKLFSEVSCPEGFSGIPAQQVDTGVAGSDHSRGSDRSCNAGAGPALLHWMHKQLNYFYSLYYRWRSVLYSCGTGPSLRIWGTV